MEFSSQMTLPPPSPPPFPSNGFSEHIHVPADNNEPRYCTTIECNNIDNDSDNDNIVANILINASSENHCVANDSTCVNASNVYDTAADDNNGNQFDFSSIDVINNNANEQSGDNSDCYATAIVNNEMSSSASDADALQNQCSSNTSALDNGGVSIESTPYKERTNACQGAFVSTSASVAGSNFSEITEHSIDNTIPSAVEIASNIPTSDTTPTCHESTKTESFASASGCAENDAGKHYLDGDDGKENEEEQEEEEGEEEAIFHFLGKANEIVRIFGDWRRVSLYFVSTEIVIGS